MSGLATARGWLVRLALATLVLAPGCPTSHVGTGAEGGLPDGGRRDAPAVGTDAPPTPPPDVPASPRRLAFVLAEADLPEVSPDGRTVGLDLDGRVSDGSGAECTDDVDYVSSITGALGVDNQFAAYIAGLLASMLGPDGFAGAFSASFTSGAGLLVLDVSGIDSLASDPMVDVHFFFGRPSAGGPPALDAAGRVRPGQAFVVAQDLGSVRGAIRGGRLEASLALLPLRFALDGVLLELPLRSTRVSAEITPTTLRGGEAGGSLGVAAFADAVAALGLAIDEATVRAVAHPDLEPSAATGECDGISTAFRFDAVLAFGPP